MTTRDRLVRDLKLVGLPVDEVEIRTPKFSKKYYGFYTIKYANTHIDKPRVYVYLHEDEECECKYSYAFLLDTAIHEMCHHLQWRNPKFERIKGVMHDDEFWKFYGYYIYKARLYGLMEDNYVTSTLYNEAA